MNAPAAVLRSTRRRVLVVTALLGLLLFVWQLGSTGLVDETPPLFAASARGMVERGDWLIPHVNGLPRYDKPPLIYWLMGALYALPGPARWDPLGSWAACLPSALASVAVMLLLADTVMTRPQPALASPGRPPSAGPPLPGTAPEAPAPWSALTALTAALAYGLSPLVFTWGRISVSDALFTALLSASLLCSWRAYAGPAGRWWQPWLLLGLAVLAKGPVAVLLLLLTLLGFLLCQGDRRRLLRHLAPVRGLVLCAAVSLPWYAVALLREGQPFWDSFFGYHNLQRFTSVVNNHLQPWWFFAPVLVVCSLPTTPLLLLGLARALRPLPAWPLAGGRAALPPEASLGRFAACWLLAVLLFFTAAATKLPSYWLPATPAAALLMALTAQVGWSESQGGSGGRADRLAWGLSLLLTLLLGAVFLAGPLWVPLIRDPEMPSLGAGLLASGRLPLAAACWILAAGLGWWWRRGRPPLRLLLLQLPLVIYTLTVLVPLWSFADGIRARPVRQMAAEVLQRRQPDESLAMVGILKPSLHFYSHRVVLYEGNRPTDLVNLADRLRRERRPGLQPAPPAIQPTLLLVIDAGTAALPWWRGLDPQPLAQAGLYRLWRLDRQRLERRAEELRARGLRPTWDLPRPERY